MRYRLPLPATISGLLLLASLLAGACGDSGTKAQSCTTDSECLPGVCIEGKCSLKCSTDADCGEGLCTDAECTAAPASLIANCESSVVNFGGADIMTLQDVMKKATITPLTSDTRPFKPTSGGEEGASACEISGTLQPKPIYNDTTSDAFPNACGDRPVYPEAVLRLPLRDGAQSVKLAICQSAGVTFWVKSQKVDTTYSFDVPMTTTSVPDPNAGDTFDKTCKCLSEIDDTAGERMSCFAHPEVSALLSTGEWQQVEIRWGDLAAPQFMALVPFDPAQVLALEWRPSAPATSQDPIDYDLWVDGVEWLPLPSGMTNWCDAGLAPPASN